MRTKEHRTTWTARVEATQLQGGGWVDFIFFHSFCTNIKSINTFTKTNMCFLPPVNQVYMSIWPITILLLDISVMCKTSVPNI